MAMTLKERTDMMVDRYGEVCTRSAAARILGREARTVTKMIEDGRLEAACAGSMVDVRSIARYIQEPAQTNEEARKRRMKAKYGSEFAV